MLTLARKEHLLVRLFAAALWLNQDDIWVVHIEGLLSDRLEIQVDELICLADVLVSHAKSVGSPADLGQRPRGLTKLQSSMTLKMHFARISVESEDGRTSL